LKKLSLVLLVVFLLTMLIPATAFAHPGAQAGVCPPGFELHQYMDHSGDPMHWHIGVTADLNGDGFICMRMLPNGAHLHVDNSIPLR
jgi:hypothetical protein